MCIRQCEDRKSKQVCWVMGHAQGWSKGLLGLGQQTEDKGKE